MRLVGLGPVVAAAVLSAAACGGDDGPRASSSTFDGPGEKASLPRGNEPVRLDPADFTTRIDHWYAQDAEGNIWYLGEDTTEYEDGELKDTEGSWEAGVDGARPGILLPADPKVGMTYRQEYYEGEAEDAAEVLSLDETANVPYGDFDHVLMTRDYTPLTPDLVEQKFYARGVGLVLAVTVSGGSDREELLTFDRANEA